METFILDTNLFFNMGAELGLGDNTEDIILGMTEKIKALKKTGKADFFMPPRIVAEFLSFFEDKEQDFIKEFLSQINIKSPDGSRINLSASIFYRLIEDIRERSYKGLNVGEEEILSSGRIMLGTGDLSKKDFEIKIGSVVKKFRERYRNATRTGFIDSVADLDLIILSLEQNGYLVTSDDGVLAWGRVFGVKELPPKIFVKKMSSLMESHHQG